jgi:glucan phosphoethanolaminetransferase (alkaline phosphatase superfamily)
MIQRIQTLWLAFIVLLSVAAFFFPIVDFTFEFKSMQTTQYYGLLPQPSTQDSEQFIQLTPAWSLVFMQIGVALIAIVSIFLYKNRPLQVKFAAGGLLFLTIYIAFLLFVKVDGLEKGITDLYAAPIVNYNKIAVSFPILQLLLFILAQRAIRKDERIVRSSDRLR